MNAITCPACSASVSQNNNGICDNCGAPIMTAAAMQSITPVERLKPDELQQIADMIERSIHPISINTFLTQHGIEPSEFDRVYAHFNVTQRKLRTNHKEARFYIFIGSAMLVLGSIMVAGKVLGEAISLFWTLIGFGLAVLGFGMTFFRPLLWILQTWSRWQRKKPN